MLLSFSWRQYVIVRTLSYPTYTKSQTRRKTGTECHGSSLPPRSHGRLPEGPQDRRAAASIWQKGMAMLSRNLFGSLIETIYRRVLGQNFLVFASARSIGLTIALFVMLSLQSGCASRSLGEQTLLQESLEGQCVTGDFKECSVWGGKKFKKRYDYCGCREHGQGV